MMQGPGPAWFSPYVEITKLQERFATRALFHRDKMSNHCDYSLVGQGPTTKSIGWWLGIDKGRPCFTHDNSDIPFMYGPPERLLALWVLTEADRYLCPIQDVPDRIFDGFMYEIEMPVLVPIQHDTAIIAIDIPESRAWSGEDSYVARIVGEVAMICYYWAMTTKVVAAMRGTTNAGRLHRPGS